MSFERRNKKYKPLCEKGLNALHTHTHTHTHTNFDPCHPVQADKSRKYSLQYFCMLKYSTTDYFQYYHDLLFTTQS